MEGFEKLREKASELEEDLTVEQLVKLASAINGLKEHDSHELIYLIILIYFMESPKSTKVSKALINKKGTAPYSGKSFR